MTSVWTSERFEPGCAVGAPAALQIAREGHADPKPFMVALAICISTSFCTPVAHETTMLVMGPGRYRFKHYLSIGSGMAVIAWLLTTSLPR
jgi:di/tricarboxylate transporter